MAVVNRVMSGAVLVVWAAAAAAEPLSRPMNRSWDETAGRVATMFYVNLKVGRRYVFETRNTRPKNSDPALVVVEEETPVAFNEDRPRTKADRRHVREARLEFIPRRVVPHAIQVRVQEGGLPGTCDVLMNGKVLGKQVPFGERFREPIPKAMPMPGKVIERGEEPFVEEYEPRQPVERRR